MPKDGSVETPESREIQARLDEICLEAERLAAVAGIRAEGGARQVIIARENLPRKDADRLCFLWAETRRLSRVPRIWEGAGHGEANSTG